MPFIIPAKRSSVTKSALFSKYKNVDSSPFFYLQRRKQHHMSLKVKQVHRPTFRIITKADMLQSGSFYTVAYSYDLAELRAREWAYVTEQLPEMLPEHFTELGYRSQRKWLVAHFTQVAIQVDGAGMDDDSDDEHSAAHYMHAQAYQQQQQQLEQQELQAKEQSPSGMAASRRLADAEHASGATESEQDPPPTYSPGSERGDSLGSLGSLGHSSQAGSGGNSGTHSGSGRHRRAHTVAHAPGGDAGTSSGSRAGSPRHSLFSHRLETGVSLAEFAAQRRPRRGQQRSSSSHAAHQAHANSNNSQPNQQQLQQQQQQPRHYHHLIGLWWYGVVASAVNIMCLLLRDSGDRSFMLTLVSVNVLLVCCVWLGNPVSVGVTLVPKAPPPPVKKRTMLARGASVHANANANANAAGGKGSLLRRRRRGRGGNGSRASYRQSSCADDESDMEAPLPSSLASAKRPGVTAEKNFPRRAQTLDPKVWWPIGAEHFNVRAGPNYARNKQKAPSGDSMFSSVAVDLFRYKEKLDHLCSFMELPIPQEDLEGAYSPSNLPDGYSVPPLFVLQFQLPSYAPALLGGKTDGPGYSLVLWFYLTPGAREKLKRSSDPAALLLKEFVEAPDKSKMRGRLKAVPRLRNPEDADVDGLTKKLLSTYNSKPFMTGPKFHSFYQGAKYIECDVDVHRFCFPARKAAYSFISTMPQLKIDFGLVVQGETDQELPERLIGSVRFEHLDPSQAIDITEFYDLQMSALN